MSKNRPTEASWDSDDELLNGGGTGISAFPNEKDEELDDALLDGDYDDLGDEQVIIELGEEYPEEYGDEQQQTQYTQEVYTDQEQQDTGGYEQPANNYEQSGFDNQEQDTTYTTQDTSALTAESQDLSAAAADDDDDEDDDDDDEETGRHRFTTERSESIRTSRPTTHEIPDTLELSNEDQQKIDEFNTKGSGRGRRQQGNNRRGNQRGNQRGNRMGPRGQLMRPPGRPLMPMGPQMHPMGLMRPGGRMMGPVAPLMQGRQLRPRGNMQMRGNMQGRQLRGNMNPNMQMRGNLNPNMQMRGNMNQNMQMRGNLNPIMQIRGNLNPNMQMRDNRNSGAPLLGNSPMQIRETNPLLGNSPMQIRETNPLLGNSSMQIRETVNPFLQLKSVFPNEDPPEEMMRPLSPPQRRQQFPPHSIPTSSQQFNQNPIVIKPEMRTPDLFPQERMEPRMSELLPQRIPPQQRPYNSQSEPMPQFNQTRTFINDNTYDNAIVTSVVDTILPPRRPTQATGGSKIHVNPHFRGNPQPQKPHILDELQNISEQRYPAAQNDDAWARETERFINSTGNRGPRRDSYEDYHQQNIHMQQEMREPIPSGYQPEPDYRYRQEQQFQNNMQQNNIQQFQEPMGQQIQTVVGGHQRPIQPLQQQQLQQQQPIRPQQQIRPQKQQHRPQQQQQLRPQQQQQLRLQQPQKPNVKDRLGPSTRAPGVVSPRQSAPTTPQQQQQRLVRPPKQQQKQQQKPSPKQPKQQPKAVSPTQLEEQRKREARAKRFADPPQISDKKVAIKRVSAGGDSTDPSPNKQIKLTVISGPSSAVTPAKKILKLKGTAGTLATKKALAKKNLLKKNLKIQRTVVNNGSGSSGSGANASFVVHVAQGVKQEKTEVVKEESYEEKARKAAEVQKKMREELLKKKAAKRLGGAQAITSTPTQQSQSASTSQPVTPQQTRQPISAPQQRGTAVKRGLNRGGRGGVQRGGATQRGGAQRGGVQRGGVKRQLSRGAANVSLNPQQYQQMMRGQPVTAQPVQAVPQQRTRGRVIKPNNTRNVVASNTNNTRIIIKETDDGPKRIKISGLAKSTTTQRLFSLANSVGPVATVEKGPGYALIAFERSSDASTFVGKFNRHILDMAVIEVKPFA